MATLERACGECRRHIKQLQENMQLKSQLIALRITVMLFLTGTAAFASDWPQYRGQNQDGISTEKLDPVWPPEGPKLIWKVPLGNGYSSFAVSGDKAFTMVSRENKGEMRELCIALDAATGKEIWAADITRGNYASQSDSYGEKGGNGACSTPTVNGGKVYAYSIDMKLCCLDAQTGKELWRVDVLKDHAGRPPFFGNTQSPVVDGDLVIVSGGGAGQSVLAINKNTGQVVWKSGDRHSDQSTPVLATILGERQAIFCLGFDLVGVSVKDGKTLWRQGIRWHDDNPSEPIVYKDQVRCGGANYAGSGLYQVMKDDDGFYTKKLWDCDHRLSPAYTTPVISTELSAWFVTLMKPIKAMDPTSALSSPRTRSNGRKMALEVPPPLLLSVANRSSSPSTGKSLSLIQARTLTRNSPGSRL